jgi:hypothetical protein
MPSPALMYVSCPGSRVPLGGESASRTLSHGSHMKRSSFSSKATPTKSSTTNTMEQRMGCAAAR